MSVIMPAFNSEKYISQAIESILRQSFHEFEFIIIDDGSTDNTFEIAKSYSDKRIKLIRNDANAGNYTARNIGIEKSNGKYICIMDSDDISYSHRIEKQFEFMDENENFGICGSYRKIVGIEGCYRAPEDNEELKVRLIGQMIFVHPSLIMRRSFLDKYKLRYDERFKYAGDYDLLVRSACHFPLTNISEILIEYRRHQHQISSKHAKEQAYLADLIRLKQLKNFKIKPNDSESKLHLKLMNRFPIKDESNFKQLREWANFLLERNNKT